VFEEADAYDTVVCAFVEGDGGGAEIGALREGGGCACGVEELVDTGYAYRLASPLHTVANTGSSRKKELTKANHHLVGVRPPLSTIASSNWDNSHARNRISQPRSAHSPQQQHCTARRGR
jgi:hypothetical protein